MKNFEKHYDVTCSKCKKKIINGYSISGRNINEGMYIKYCRDCDHYQFYNLIKKENE